MNIVALLRPGTAPPPARVSRSQATEQNSFLAELIRSCAHGDRHAFRDLYGHSQRFVVGVVRAIISDEAVAEDVTREIYVMIWRKAETFDSKEGRALAWMGAISRNLAIDRLRSERANGANSYSNELPELASDEQSAEVTADAKMLRRVLDDLRPEFREALLLSYFKGYSHAELAAVMNVPVGTAKSWVRRGLTALQETLND